jgi:hypothetical protein
MKEINTFKVGYSEIQNVERRKLVIHWIRWVNLEIGFNFMMNKVISD